MSNFMHSAGENLLTAFVGYTPYIKHLQPYMFSPSYMLRFVALFVTLLIVSYPGLSYLNLTRIRMAGYACITENKSLIMLKYRCCSFWENMRLSQVFFCIVLSSSIYEFVKFLLLIYLPYWQIIFVLLPT